jgi:predicted helicase
MLADSHVEILDPAVGTGTYICDIIEHLKANKAALRYKYLNEMHCNEVAILPYYIANLNIEYTYAQAMGEYAEFPHICFVDTLDNLGFEKTHSGQQRGFDFGMTAENTDRIARQNRRKISVIIGNPPYNANQMNENDNNKNRLYEGIDKRIKETWIAASAAQKTKMYDMYARFFRWAADRINADGVVAFITNRSFIDSRTFDGFRTEMAKEFNEAWIMDLGGDVRANPKLSGTTHNVFGIQTGVAISFWVKKHKQKGCKVFYARRPELEIADDKLAFLAETPFDKVEFQHVVPDAKGNWINQADNDFDELLPLCSKETKASSSQNKERALFRMFSLGVVTARDEWVFDNNDKSLGHKVRFLIKTYEHDLKTLGGRPTAEIVDDLDGDIKWTRAVKSDLRKGVRYDYDQSAIRSCLYRPFVKKRLYFDKHLNEVRYQLPNIFPHKYSENICITFLSIVSAWPLATLATTQAFDYCLLKTGNGATQSVPLYVFDEAGNRADNITDWGVKQFEKRYGKRAKITRLDIFHYVYAVLHDPAYREKYALNLKRELPRIPFYDNFRQWADWGRTLLELHVGFETVAPWPLERREQAGVEEPKAKLKADREAGIIVLDEATRLLGVPPEAWDYRLGNRSALEWVLDQYKESAPRDPTIREKFNTYRFADYKEHVIDLLARVCTVSVETQRIVEAMRRETADA